MMRTLLLAGMLAMMTVGALADDADQAVLDGVAAYNHGDYATAFRLLKQEADRGNSDAQVNLGYMYVRGQGTLPSRAEANRLYALSAAQGNGEAMNAIGFVNENSRRPDVPRAITWYCRAIARGNPRALNNLAVMYDSGRGVVQDPDEARSLWRQAAERGDANSMWNLARSLLWPRQGPADPAQAEFWLRRAAAAGQADAQQLLRQAGDRSAMPAPRNTAAEMRLQPADAPPGMAQVCGAPIS